MHGFTDWSVFLAILFSFLTLLSTSIYLFFTNRIVMQTNQRLRDENTTNLEMILKQREYIRLLDKKGLDSETLTEIIEIPKTFRPGRHRGDASRN
jgi:hypothetical protein